MSRQPKGSGSFTKTPNGNWNLRKCVTRNYDNQKKYLSATATTKTACIKLMAKREAEYQNQRCTANEELTLVELCQQHLDYCIKSRELTLLNSIERRQQTINQIEYSEIGNLPLSCISSTDLQLSVINLKSLKDSQMILSVSSREKAMNCINAAYNWGIMMHYVSDNPMKFVINKIKDSLNAESSKYSDDIDVEHLSLSDIKKLKESCNARSKNGENLYPVSNLVLFLLNTGLRIGECLALRWSDWNSDTQILSINKSRTSYGDSNASKGNKYIMRDGKTKNKRSRNIELSDEANECLKTIFKETSKNKPTDFIFITKTGNPDTTSNVESKANKLYRHAKIYDSKGLPLTGLHVLRHTFATMAYNNGMPIEDVAAYIGDSVDVARRYYVANRIRDEKKGIYIPYKKNKD